MEAIPAVSFGAVYDALRLRLPVREKVALQSWVG